MELPLQNISDYVQNETATSFAVVRKKEVKEFDGGVFLSLELGDASGRIGAVWWEPDRFALEELEEGDIVKVRGTVGAYRGRPQLKIGRLRRAEKGEFKLSELLPHSKVPPEELKGRVLAMSDKVENSFIKELMDSFWKDEQFLESYIKASAGKLWHHSYIGGLAEHSLNVTEICLDMARRYDFLDRDLLIFGGLFHDMGKIYQYEIGAFIDYSDEGRLVGHINIADSMVAERAKEIQAFPPRLLSAMRHLILSHHGSKEFASPIEPQIPEAFVLYYADEIDSKMGAIERIRDKTGGEGWSDFVKLLNRYLYFGEKNK